MNFHSFIQPWEKILCKIFTNYNLKASHDFLFISLRFPGIKYILLIFFRYFNDNFFFVHRLAIFRIRASEPRHSKLLTKRRAAILILFSCPIYFLYTLNIFYICMHRRTLEVRRNKIEKKLRHKLLAFTR